MQVYALKLHNFLRFGEKDNTIVFDLSQKQKDDLANGSITMDEIYSQVALDPVGHIAKSKKRGLEKQIGIIGLVDGDPESSNGVGKSSIMESICYAHYEKIVRKTANTDKIEKAGLCVVTRVNGDYPKDLKESYVEEFFEDNGSVYRIKRGRTFSKNQKSSTPVVEFECISKGEIDSLSSHRSGDTKESISDVISMDYDVFVNSQMFGQNDAGKFLTGTDKTKKEMLISLLRLENVVDGCLEMLRKKKNSQEKSVTSIKSNVEFLGKMIGDGYNKYIGLNNVAVETFSDDIYNKLLEHLDNSLLKNKSDSKICDDLIISQQSTMDKLIKSEKLIIVSRIKDEGRKIKEIKESKEKDKLARVDEWKKLLESTISDIGIINSEIKQKHLKQLSFDNQLTNLKQQIDSFDLDKTNKKIAVIQEKKQEGLSLSSELRKNQQQKQDLVSKTAILESDKKRFQIEINALQKQISEVKDGEQFTCDKCKSQVSKNHILSEIKIISDKVETIGANINEFSKNLVLVNEEIKKIEDSLLTIEKYKLAEEKFLGEIKTNQVVKNQYEQIVSSKNDIIDEIGKLNERLKVANDKQIEYTKNIQEISVQFDEEIEKFNVKINDLRERYNKAKEDAKSVEDEIANLKSQIVNNGNVKNQYSQKIGSLENEIKQFAKFKSDYDIKTEEYKNSVKLFNRYSLLEGIYGLDGIQTRIVKKYLPLLNVYIKEFLDILSNGNISVDLIVNDKSKIDMEITGGSADSYDMLSGGEKMIVRLAVDIGLALLSFSRSAQKPEIICLDEIFGCLDANHRDGVFRMLDKLQDKFSRILIISHEKETCEKIPSRIIIEKDSGVFGLSKILRIE